MPTSKPAGKTPGKTSTPKSGGTRRSQRRARPATNTRNGGRPRRARQDNALAQLFSDTPFTRRTAEGVIELVPIDQLQVRSNPRRKMDPEGISRLAQMLMCHGQLVPAIGRRVSEQQVDLYAGQRRMRACEKSVEIAGSPGFENLAPVTEMVVLLLDYEPSEADVRRIQAQENSREQLSLADQQRQFADVWADRAPLPEEERIRAVCIDLGISPVKAHNLRRQLTLPEELRERVSERPADGELSVTLANQLADMHSTAPALARACAERVTTRELHEQALSNLPSFVARTIAEDQRVYALRLDMVTVLDAHAELTRARPHLDENGRAVLCPTLQCKPAELDKALNKLASRAKEIALTVDVDETLRSRAANGRYAWVHRRSVDLPDGVWVIDPAFTIGIIHERLEASDAKAAISEPGYFKADGNEREGQETLQDARAQREAERLNAAQAYSRNITLGNQVQAILTDLGERQAEALRGLVVHLLAELFGDLIAYGAGWTNQDHQKPTGERGGMEPIHPQSIVEAEVDRALADSDPLHGIAQIVTRLGCAFLLDPDGVPASKMLGRKRIERIRDRAIPGGEHPARAAMWQLMLPALSPALIDMHRDAFLQDRAAETIDLDAYRKDSSLSEIDLGEEEQDLLAA